MHSLKRTQIHLKSPQEIHGKCSEVCSDTFLPNVSCLLYEDCSGSKSI